MVIALMPTWIGSHASPGMPIEAAKINGFLLDQPMIKFPFFTAGEVTPEQIKAFMETCNALTYTP
jgi:hypothetical protein